MIPFILFFWLLIIRLFTSVLLVFYKFLCKNRSIWMFSDFFIMTRWTKELNTFNIWIIFIYIWIFFFHVYHSFIHSTRTTTITDNFNIKDAWNYTSNFWKLTFVFIYEFQLFLKVFLFWLQIINNFKYIFKANKLTTGTSPSSTSFWFR